MQSNLHVLLYTPHFIAMPGMKPPDCAVYCETPQIIKLSKVKQHRCG